MDEAVGEEARLVLLGSDGEMENIMKGALSGDPLRNDACGYDEQA